MASQVNFGSGAAAGAPPQDLATLYGMSQGMLDQPILLGGPPLKQLQYGKVSDALQAFYALSTEQVAGLQNQLYGTPFWTSSKAPVAGNVNDPNTFDAYKNAVIAAARGHQTLDEVLFEASQGGTGLGTPSAAPPSTRVYPGGKVAITQTDPETIRLTANATAQKLMGRDLSTAEAQAVVDTVRQDEAKKGGQQAALDESQREAQIQTNETMYGGGPTGATGAAAAAPAGANGSPDVVSAITQAANELGVPVNLALAIAQHESGLDPNVAVQDHHADGSPAGMSVGLYQLNDNGEGAGMSVEARKDPLTNARTALSVVAGVLKAHPDWSPGQIAAAAQRPAEPGKYADAVNALLQNNGVPVQGVTPGGSKGTTTDVFLQPTTQDISTPITPEGAATQVLDTYHQPEVQEYALQTQLQNFTSALHGVPGDVGATKAVKA